MAKKTKSYSEAMAEINEIMRKIENEELDVDDLAEQVKTALDLIKLCESKLYKTQSELDAILKENQTEVETDE